MERPLQAQLSPRIGILDGVAQCASLQILLAPFLFDSEIVDTSIRLDKINLPSIALVDLVGRSFTFPVDPEDRSIDGSIYLNAVHHPVDVTSMAFHIGRDRRVTVVLKGAYHWYLGQCGQVDKQAFAFGVRVATCAV
jgi:hypothetical protein